MPGFFLRSSRLGFRCWHESDLPLARALWGDPAVTRFIAAGGLPEREIRARLVREIETQQRCGMQYWPIFLLATGEHVGCCGLRPHGDDPARPEFGVHVSSRHWRQGFAFEAASRAIEHAFSVIGVAALFAGHNPANVASRGLLTKLGFVYTHDEFYAPTGLDHPSYILTRSEAPPDPSLAADGSAAVRRSTSTFNLCLPRVTSRHDTGTNLRSLFAPEGGVRSVFSAKVGDYAASRPDYPEALFETLRIRCALPDAAAVADIGAGTGLLTKGLLTRGYRVVAVEPNPSMRAAADRLLGGFAGYRGVDGCAESMPLEGASVHLVTAAQAFHWFEVDRARAECLRVLVPHGQVALIWNDRVLEDPLHAALDSVFTEFGGAKRAALVAHEDRSDVPRFFGATRPEEFSWPHEHFLDAEGLMSLVFSRSYIPGRSTAAGRAIADRVRRIFEGFAANGVVKVRYRTVAMLGRPA